MCSWCVAENKSPLASHSMRARLSGMADPIKTAKTIFDTFLSKADPVAIQDMATIGESQAQISGRIGGKVGGPARAKKLSPAHRKSIAKLAAKKRWEK